MLLPHSAEIMVAGHNTLNELNGLNLLQIHNLSGVGTRSADIGHTAIHVLLVECKAQSQQRASHLCRGHDLSGRHATELLDELMLDARMLVEHVTNLTNRTTDLS